MLAPGFTGGTLDRADRLRHDEAGLAAARADTRARLLRLTDYEPELDAAGRLIWQPMTAARADADFVLLGLDLGVPHFAAFHPDDAPARGRSPALFQMLAQMPGDQAAIYAAARSVTDWHARHRFCSICGTPSMAYRAGWARKCPHCGGEHFPRVDPVVIMIAEHDGRALLGRQQPWPEGRYSALAGFVEPGESLEEAVARETFEEAGVRVRDVRYIASQPWPFPGSLMVACTATAESDLLNIDTHELEDAMWVSRADVRAALAGEPAPFLPPPPYAIAHTLLTAWANAGG